MKIIKLTTISILLFTSLTICANQKTTSAEECLTLICVRNNIDQIDQQIVKLIGQRLAYVKRAGEIKSEPKKINDQKRESQILSSVRKLAEKEGYPGSIAVKIFKTILRQSKIYERAQLAAKHSIKK